MIGNTAQKEEQVHLIILFSIIICVFMVLFIPSVALFVDNIKIANEQAPV